MSEEAAVAAAGIHVMRIPTPFAIGRVNCYLIEDKPLTLIDTGPNSGTALDELEGQLAGLGRSIEEIELIVITHQHIDHFGLVEIVARRSGAEVAAIDKVVHFVENFGDDAEAEDQFAAALMRRNGIPEDVTTALLTVSRGYRGWGGKAEVTRPLVDGELYEMGERTIEVMHRPGHSPSDTLFWDSQRRILLVGDHLLEKVSSNPLMSRSLDGSEERPQALVAYIDSLLKTRELPAEIILPGHGDPVTDHVALIDERMRMHERRAEKLLGLIKEQPLTGYELAQALWGNVAVTQAFLTLSEVIGHVDLLLNAGLVREAPKGEVVRFEATGAEGTIKLGNKANA
jgi:glyoxylase-like metal-dependent hydrolase (beta-lactamase superfamily II)